MIDTRRFEEFVTLPISNQIEQQFPGWYREQGPQFMAFVKAYYEWMELSGNTNYYTRNYYNIKDIDNTLDEFIIYFKEKYLKNIQLTTKSDTRQVVKHALDIYRSKGTPRCIELLFRLVYNEDVELYYPGLDLMKLSDGEWYKPSYLELQLSRDNVLLVHKEITGVTSHAIAYVDSVVRRQTKRVTRSRLQDIAYISAITGQFTTGEKVIPTDGSLVIGRCPIIIGSLTELRIPDSGIGAGYAVGDIVPIYSDYGEAALGRVSSTVDRFGEIASSLRGGGYGYNSSEIVYVANTMMRISNVQFTTPQRLEYFPFLDTINQELVFLNYYNATLPVPLDSEIFTYYGNGAVMGHGIILQKNQLSITNGAILCGVYSGSLANTIHTTANAVTANLQLANGQSWANATGKFIANDSVYLLTINNATGNFGPGDDVISEYGIGKVIHIANNVVSVSGVERTMRIGSTITSVYSGVTADIIDVAFEIGLCNTHGTFYNFAGNKITGSYVTGSIDRQEQGSGLVITIPNIYLYSETITVPTDLIAPYLSVKLNATSYGFPANTSANLTQCKVAQCFNYANVTVGKAISLIVSNTGLDYSRAPFITVDNPIISDLGNHDIVLTYNGGNYIAGEMIQQPATQARGLVKTVGSGVMLVENLRVNANNQFMLSNSTATTMIVGSEGSTANITAMGDDEYNNIMGRNMTFEAHAAVGNGAIRTLDIVDSGFGFLNDEELYLGGGGAAALTRIQHQGTGQGYYKKKGGFLSDQKKLFDGWYWQNYSYDVISSLMLNKYSAMLNQITHISGTLMFGRTRYKTDVDATLDATAATVTIS